MQQVDEIDKKTGAQPNKPSKLTDSIKELLGQIIAIDNTNKDLMKKDVEDTKGEVEAVKAELRDIRQRMRQGESYVPEYGIYREEGVFFDKRE